MELLRAGVDRSVIALCLGHELVETTQIYLDANLALKEQALAKTIPANAKNTGRYRPDDKLLAFLKVSRGPNKSQIVTIGIDEGIGEAFQIQYVRRSYAMPSGLRQRRLSISSRCLSRSAGSS